MSLKVAACATILAAVVGVGLAFGLSRWRSRLGEVVDFLDFSGLMFPWVFNVADSAITVGVALLLLDAVMPAKAAASGAEDKPV